MRVLVTGGSGFIGTSLVGELLKAHHQVTIFDKDMSSKYPDLVVVGDVRDKDAIIKAASLWYAAKTHPSFQDAFATLRKVLWRKRIIVMFGNATETPQNEDTPLHPRSAYGISKVAGYHLTENYRSTYNLHASNGILFNHESPRRGFEFVTRKITSHAAKIKLGLQNKIKLGNLEARRDWGHAREYVKAMWLMLQQDEPGDYVVATGQTHSVREFLEAAFDYVGLNPYEYLEEDQTLYRPSEVFVLQGDASRAKRMLEWENNCDFESLVEDMVKADLNLLSRHSRSAGIPANVLAEVGSRV